MVKEVKNRLEKEFELVLLESLKSGKNPARLAEEYNISKPLMSYYLRKLKSKNLIRKIGYGTWEVTKEVKNSTKYDSLLKKDMIRGHAFVWNINLKSIPERWSNRLEILKNNNIHFVLVGALKNTPRIKVLGRKVWLCNNHIRIFDMKGKSYYGKNAIESRTLALNELSSIIQAIESKLNLNLKHVDFEFKKEHYALIKNDLAIEHNKRGEMLHVIDKQGEWLLIDDSLGEGGELENIGSKAFLTNIPMQKWWNEHKETNFEVRPKFIIDSFNKIVEFQAKNELQIQKFSSQIKSHLALIKEYRKENISWRKQKEIDYLSEKKAFNQRKQKKISDYI